MHTIQIDFTFAAAEILLNYNSTTNVSNRSNNGLKNATLDGKTLKKRSYSQTMVSMIIRL